MTKDGITHIPFDEKGNQLTYAGWPTKEYTPAYEFTDTLTYKDCARGRSSMHWHWTFTRQDAGTTVTFFLGEFERLIPFMRWGTIVGRFTFRQRGANYTCTLLEAA